MISIGLTADEINLVTNYGIYLMKQQCKCLNILEKDVAYKVKIIGGKKNEVAPPPQADAPVEQQADAPVELQPTEVQSDQQPKEQTGR